jgi:16S rRNA (adenine1518-N6/adenine1519-N6)-dimethyltransferase
MLNASLPPLREVIAANGLDAKKGLGQHFLLDLNVTQKIARLAEIPKDSTVFEIGPGPGGLTRALIESPAGEIVAIEKDPRCVKALQPLVRAAAGRLRLIEADALETDLTTLAPAPRVIVANLPYNVGTPLLIAWLKQTQAFESLTLMFQEEVADRFVAAPGSKAYGRLAVLAQSLCRVQKVMTLPARAFTPPPKIASAVLRFMPKARPADAPPLAALERLTAAAFGQRRKMLRSSLKPLGGESLLAAAAIPATARAEEIGVGEYEKLARLLECCNATC